MVRLVPTYLFSWLRKRRFCLDDLVSPRAQLNTIQVFNRVSLQENKCSHRWTLTTAVKIGLEEGLKFAITHITEKERTMQDVMYVQLLEKPDLMISSDTVMLQSRIVPQRSTNHVMQNTSDDSARNTT